MSVCGACDGPVPTHSVSDQLDYVTAAPKRLDEDKGYGGGDHLTKTSIQNPVLRQPHQPESPDAPETILQKNTHAHTHTQNRHACRLVRKASDLSLKKYVYFMTVLIKEPDNEDIYTQAGNELIQIN